MKKLLLLAVIGWMSIMAVSAQKTDLKTDLMLKQAKSMLAFNAGYSFELGNGMYPSRFDFSIDWYKPHLMLGAGTKIPSSNDPRFEISVHGGVNFFWNDFWVTPRIEIAVNHQTSWNSSVGAGLQANYCIVGPLTVFTSLSWQSPVEFKPKVVVGPGGRTMFTIGLAMLWFRY